MLEDRYDATSPTVTANTGLSHWKTMFPSEATAVSTVDRLVGRSTILRFTGETFRKNKEVPGAPIND